MSAITIGVSEQLLSAKRAMSQRWLRAGGATKAALTVSAFSVASVRAGARRQICAVGVGTKASTDSSSGQPCVRFYVTRKLPLSMPPLSARLPTIVSTNRPTQEALQGAKLALSEMLLGRLGVHGVGLHLRDGAVVLYHHSDRDETVRLAAAEVVHGEVDVQLVREAKPRLTRSGGSA
ncbi:MAG: hypothetical protein ACT4QA_12685 [Panacagrimonas sp.]